MLRLAQDDASSTAGVIAANTNAAANIINASGHPSAPNALDVLPGVVASIAPLTGPAAPFVYAAAAFMKLGESIYHFFSHYDPQKLHDTAVVEAFEMAWHTLWYAVSGETLPGIPGQTATTQPGNYGNAGIDLFHASSYPNVPFPAGRPGIDLDQAIAALQQTFQAAAQQMQRPQSIPNIQGNFNYAMQLLQQVRAAAAQQQTVFTFDTTSSSLPAWAPLLLLAAVAFGGRRNG